MNPIVVTLIVVGYVVCGFVAYGLTKGNFRNFYQKLTHVGYGTAGELWCWFIVSLGPIGILAISIISVITDGFGWCLRMPPELTQKYRDKKK